MATYYSTATSLLVQAPAALSSSFGSGSATGSFSADVWTPGFDANGVVNAASWNLVPPGRWIAIAGSELSALTGATLSGTDFGVDNFSSAAFCAVSCVPFVPYFLISTATFSDGSAPTPNQ